MTSEINQLREQIQNTIDEAGISNLSNNLASQAINCITRE